MQGVSLEHASKITLYARASREGMRVAFAVGSESPKETAYFDSAGTGGTQEEYIINQAWNSDEIPLKAPSGDWSDINELFIITFKPKSKGSGWGSGII